MRERLTAASPRANHRPVARPADVHPSVQRDLRAEYPRPRGAAGRRAHRTTLDISHKTLSYFFARHAAVPPRDDLDKAGTGGASRNEGESAEYQLKPYRITPVTEPTATRWPRPPPRRKVKLRETT